MLGISRDLVHRLGECAHICNDCFMACLEEEDIKMMVECIKLCKECAAVCSHTIDLVYRGSHFKKQQLQLCAEACSACAEECGKHDTEHNQKCAQACRECEKECRAFMDKVKK